MSGLAVREKSTIMPTMVGFGRLVHALLAGLACAAAGCSALSGACDRSDDGNPPDPYYDGSTADGFYMSSDWTGSLLPFTGGKRYAFHHDLGCTPAMVNCYVSFSAEGIENGSIAHPAGNMCVIQDINDGFILVKNDTCAEMYVMVTAAGCVPRGDAGAIADAGGDGG